MRAAFFIAVFVALSSVAQAQTLVEAINATLVFSPIIKTDESNLEAAQELQKQARSGYLPSVDLLLGVGQERSDNTTTRANGWLGETITRQERSLQVTQMLYDGFFTRNRVK
ncbi:MAG: TolC family protein, partial [Luminiphilus sp.]